MLSSSGLWLVNGPDNLPLIGWRWLRDDPVITGPEVRPDTDEMRAHEVINIFNFPDTTYSSSAASLPSAHATHDAVLTYPK